MLHSDNSEREDVEGRETEGVVMGLAILNSVIANVQNSQGRTLRKDDI